MKVESLAAFLSGEENLSAFKSEISPEVRESARLGGIPGSTVPITVEESGAGPFIIGAKEVRRLCAAFVDGDLSTDELAYISDAMQLSESFEWSEPIYFEMVFSMSDPAINGPFTVEAGQALLSQLGPPNLPFNPDPRKRWPVNFIR